MTINSYALKDTGYANTSATGTQETMANSGTALQIHIKSMTWRRGTGSSSNPNPGTYEETETNVASVSNPVIRIQGVLNKGDASYESDVGELDAMCTTKGLKLFYYTVTTDGYKPITNIKGSVTHGSLQVDGMIKSILVKPLSFDLTESNNNPIKGQQTYNMELEVTKPKTL